MWATQEQIEQSTLPCPYLNDGEPRPVDRKVLASFERSYQPQKVLQQFSALPCPSLAGQVEIWDKSRADLRNFFFEKRVQNQTRLWSAHAHVQRQFSITVLRVHACTRRLYSLERLFWAALSDMKLRKAGLSATCFLPHKRKIWCTCTCAYTSCGCEGQKRTCMCDRGKCAGIIVSASAIV